MFRKLKSKFSKWKPQRANKDEPLFNNLEELRQEFNKLGKSQLRSNTIAEIDRKQIKNNLLQLLKIHSNQNSNRPDAGFIKDLLEVADSLEEAVKAAERIQPQEDQSISNWLSGIRITRKRIMKLFEKWDVRPIDAVGNPFDPNLHVSVDVKRTSDVPENTVIEEQRRGYLLGNEVIRYAEVVVAKPPIMIEVTPAYISNVQTGELASKVNEQEISQKSNGKEISDSSTQGCILWANDDFVD